MYVAEYPIIPADISLPFQLTGIGKCSNQCKIVRNNGFNLHMIFYTRKGRGKLIYGGNQYILNKGDIIILSKDISYEYEPISESWHTSWITFIGTHIDETIKSLHLEKAQIIHYDNLEPVEDIFKKMIGLLKNRTSHWMYSCSGMLYTMLTDLASHSIEKQTIGETAEESYIEDVINYIDTHFSEYISLENLAEISGVTPEHLCKIFRNKVNMRPFEYVARKRIQESKLLLETTTLPISEIGERVGYEDKSYFGYVFKKYEKISPTQFRGVKGKQK